MNNFLLNQFLIGSLVSIVPLVGLKYFYTKHPILEQINGSYNKIAIKLPFIYGILNILITIVVNILFANINEQHKYFIKGFIEGLILSYYGRFSLNLTEYAIKLPNDNLLHIFIPIMYGLIYMLIIQPFYQIIII